MAGPLLAEQPDPESDQLLEQTGGVSDTDPSLRSTAALPKAPPVDTAVTDVRTSLATQRKAEGETEPQSWGDCYITTPEGTRIIDFEKARDFLRKKMKDSTDPWSPTPELALAIAKNPGKEEPFSLGVFTPTRPREKDEQRKHAANFELMMRYSLLSSGADPSLVSDKTVKQFMNTYLRNLDLVRRTHPEVRVNGEIELTTKDVFEDFIAVKRILTAPREREGDDTLALYNLACRLFYDIPKILSAKVGASTFSVTAREETIPEYFFGHGKTDDKLHRDRFVSLMMLLSKCGFINLKDYEEISMDEETSPQRSTEAARLAAQILAMKKRGIAEEILRILDMIMWSGRKAINFLKTGEKMYGSMQKAHLIPKGLTSLDEADYLEDLKNKSPYELLQYAMDTKNPIDWRHQAVMLAFIGLQFISIHTSTHYRNAPTVDRKMRDTFLEKIAWEKDETNPRKLRSVKHKYYANGRGDYSTDRNEEYGLEREMDCRIWKGISGKEYHIRIIDDEHAVKSEQSILFKALLRNSDGDPRELFDLVRFTFVFANVEDFNDPTVRKDIYHLLFEVGRAYGMHPKLVQAGEDIDWENDDADKIYGKVTKARSSMGAGYFTLEDKTNGKKGGISSESFEDIKLVGRDHPHETGMELQCQTLRSYLLAISTHEEAGHTAYDNKKARKLLKQMNPSYIYPRTFLRLEALGLLERASILRKKSAQSELTDTLEAEADIIIELIREVEERGEDMSDLKEKVEQTAIRLATLRYNN